MKFKLNAVASICLLGALLGCAPLMSGTPLASSAMAPTRAQASAVPVKVAQASVISASITSSAAQFTMGLAAHGAGQLALASQRYEQVLKITPEHVGALNGLAVIYAQTDRTDEALRLFVRASVLAPGAAHVRNNTGYTLLRAGRLDEAEIALNQARALDPSNAQTQQNLALLANAKAKRQSAELAGQPEAGDKDAPRLVVVAPSVFELQVPASASAKVAAPASADLRDTRLEVSNGVGISRLARRTADRLATEGIKTARLTNALPYKQAKTEIQYVAGQAEAAQALQARLPVATDTVAATRLHRGVQVRLVLGHDLAGKSITAWLASEEKQQLATSAQGGWRWS